MDAQLAQEMSKEVSAALALAQRQRAESESLRQVTHALLAQRTLEDVLELVAESTQRLIGTERSMVFLLGDDGRLHAAVRRDSPLREHPTVAVEGSRIGQAVQSGQPIIAQMPLPAEGVPPLIAALPLADAREVALLAVPLKVDGAVIGVLTAVNGAANFSEEDVRAVSIFADQAAVAIKHAHLVRQVESLAIVEERQRLARELHDAVTQSIYSITLFTEAGRQMLVAGEISQAEHYLSRIGDMSQQALKELRLLIHELRPPILARDGLVAALRQRLAAVEERAGVQARLLAEPVILPATVEDALYRIAQEALNNALKHARAAHITIQLTTELVEQRPHVKLQIGDDGCGWQSKSQHGDVKAGEAVGGLGMLSMQERAKALGGICRFVSEPARGTVVEALIPLP
jgi:signal transduction histidine kinase